MIGFFEHQYLTYKKNHIRNLLALANADGHMHEKEVTLLYKIAHRYGLKEWQVQKLMESNEKYDINIPDNHNDKMNVLYDLILMVYADEVVEEREIQFCEEVAERFGMKKEIVRWLLKVFDMGTPPPPDEWAEIREHALKDYVLSGK
jgi:uncharacterized membrane protein YebE (DUF533 family)